MPTLEIGPLRASAERAADWCKPLAKVSKCLLPPGLERTYVPSLESRARLDARAPSPRRLGSPVRRLTILPFQSLRDREITDHALNDRPLNTGARRAQRGRFPGEPTEGGGTTDSGPSSRPYSEQSVAFWLGEQPFDPFAAEMTSGRPVRIGSHRQTRSGRRGRRAESQGRFESPFR
jgi:hypothetical protein